jgi:hypothetical protein
VAQQDAPAVSIYRHALREMGAGALLQQQKAADAAARSKSKSRNK